MQVGKVEEQQPGRWYFAGQRLGRAVSFAGERALFAAFEAVNTELNYASAACELVAISAGMKPDLEFWCAPAHKWLQSNEYTASKEVTARAAEVLKNAGTLSDSAQRLSEFFERLPRRRAKLRKAEITPRKLKKLLSASYGDKADVFTFEDETTVGISPDYS
jgi:hypothetical protein